MLVREGGENAPLNVIRRQRATGVGHDKGIETSPKQTASTLLSSTSVMHSLCLLLSNEAITTLSHTALVLEGNYNGV